MHLLTRYSEKVLGGGGVGGLISGIRKCFRTTRQNVSENRIKAFNIPLHFELQFNIIIYCLCVTVNGEFISKTSIKPTYATV